MKSGVYILLLVAALCTSVFAYSQSKTPTAKELNARIARIEEEIRKNEALQNKIKSDQKVKQSELKLVRSQIDNRKQLVNTLNSQMSILDREISLKNKHISDMGREVGIMKQQYAEMIYAAYKNHILNNSVSFLFAAEDFDDATVRIDYMRRYNKMREKKVSEIKSLTDELSAQIGELDKQKNELIDTRRARDKELVSLQTDESKLKVSTTKLAQDEKKIVSVIKAKQKEKQTAEAQLRKIIAEEAKKSSVTKRSAEDAKRMAQLTGDFVQNKGKYAYPVQGGIIIDRFGRHAHPTQKGLSVENKGVNIAGEKESSVRVIFDGTVTRVIFIKGLNNCVMVQHGDYFTVYSNLGAVSVKANEKLTKNQVIGKLPATEDSDDYFLHFELWKVSSGGPDYLNPESWFYR